MEVKNKNYCGTIVKINTLVPIENSDNIQHAIIMGNSVIVDKKTYVGDVGIYFPLETQLSKEYLKRNNLYRNGNLNDDITKKGYFEENGRIRCVKLRGNKSEGLYMPLSSIKSFYEDAENLPEGEDFDTLNGIEICKKYIPKEVRTPGLSGSKNKKGRSPKEEKLLPGQFKFHSDTGMLYKNMHRFNLGTFIDISYKMHGTSAIVSYILCNKKLKWYEKILKKLGVNIVDSEYDYIYSSRKVIKNEQLNSGQNSYYSEDIWKITSEKLKPFLQKGMTFYYEVVGFLPNGAYIQKDYDYGYEAKEHGIYIYRITYTNIDGKVFEYSAHQVKEFCIKHGLNSVDSLFQGTVAQFIHYANDSTLVNLSYGPNDILDCFLSKVKEFYNEHNCYMCNNTVPEEGCVVRIEGLEFEAYKQKSNRFYERETKNLDLGEVNIEDEN